jgi:hypothetical protein
MAIAVFRLLALLPFLWAPIFALVVGFDGIPSAARPALFNPAPAPATSADSARPGSISSNPSTVISDTEELLYEASWWAFKLGQIRIRTTVSRGADGNLRPSATAYIDSYGNLPFVDVHSISATEMDSTLSTITSRSIEKRKDEWWVLKHDYYPETKKLITETTWQRTKDSVPYTPPNFDTLTVEGQLEDGLSIFFFARANLHSFKTFRLPTIVYEALGRTTLEFTGDTKTIDIEGYEEPIAVKGLRGMAEFEGLFGMSGEFEGWFTDDAAAVPVKAKLGVIIGSIELELKKWKRVGWTPPRAK